MTELAGRNPFLPKSWRRTTPVQILWPVGNYAAVDLHAEMAAIDALLEDGDVLGARQRLWGLGTWVTATMLLPPDDVDNAYLAGELAQMAEEMDTW